MIIGPIRIPINMNKYIVKNPTLFESDFSFYEMFLSKSAGLILVPLLILSRVSIVIEHLHSSIFSNCRELILHLKDNSSRDKLFSFRNWIRWIARFFLDVLMLLRGILVSLNMMRLFLLFKNRIESKCNKGNKLIF